MTIRAIAATAALLVPLAATAQDTAPGPVPLPWTLPPGNSVTPPAVEPPVVPAPEAAPTPTPTPRRAPRPQPTATPSPAATPRPRPAPSPTPEAVPTAEPTPVAAAPTAEPEPAEVAPVVESTPEPTVAATDLPPVTSETAGDSRSSLLWVLLAAVLIAGLAALLFWRRRKPEEAPDEMVEAAPEPAMAPVPVAEPEPVDPAEPVATPEQPRFLNRPVPASEPASAPQPEAPSFLTRPMPAPEGLVVSTAFRRQPAVPEAPAADRAPLDFTFLPMAMGTEGDKAVVRFELGAGNPTDMAVPELRFAAGLFGASPQQDAEIERFFAEMPPHAQLQPFPVAAGESRKVEATVSLPLDNLPVLTAGERRFFVPVMAIDARYRWADGREARTRVAFVVGRQIQGSDKLAPVFLDRGDRMVDRLEARVHGEVRRD
jgi:hypothetical protein